MKPKVQAATVVAVLFAVLVGLQAAVGQLPQQDWAVGLQAVLGPILAVAAAYLKADNGK
jgi:type IV secretory pathway VirB2 component (pilin)